MRSLLIFALTVAAAAPARAQRALTLDEALSMARAQNKDLKSAHTRIEQAQVAVRQAWVALLPTAAVNGKYTHNYKEVTLDLAAGNRGLFGLGDLVGAQVPGTIAPNLAGSINALKQGITDNSPSSIVIQRAEQLDFALSGTVPLVVPWAYSALDASKRNVAAAQANFGVTETALLYTTAQAFFAAAGSDELVLARLHAIEVNQKTVENAQARLEAGVVNRVEVTRAQLALLRAQQAAVEANDAEAQGYRALRTLIQIQEPFRVVPNQVPPPVGANADELAKGALKLRPEFVALERNIDAFDANATSNKWRWAPTLSGFGNLRAFNNAGFAGDNYAWALGLSLDWVVYDGGVRDVGVRLAHAQRDELAYRLSQLKDTVTDDLYNAQHALGTRRSALDTALRSVDLARETLDLVRVQHDAGTATQLDLLTAQDTLVGAEVAVAQARFDLALADLSLRRTAGTFR